MGLFDSILGAVKLGSNILGGGSGSKSTTNSSQSSTSNTQGTTTASRRELSDPFMALLETNAATAIARSQNTGDALTSQTDKIQKANLGGAPLDFDVDSYVRGITEAARSQVTGGLERDIAGAMSSTGGSTSGNSQAALLANRLRNDAGASLAGVQSNATAEGTKIKLAARDQQVNELASGTAQLSGIQSTVDAGLTSLLSALRGAETFQEVNNNETTNSSGSGTSTTKTPFNWTKGLGNLFADVNQDQ